MYLSVIVTTAKLIVWAFDSQHISLSTGGIANEVYTEEPFLRFRKQLGTHRDMPTVELNRKGIQKNSFSKGKDGLYRQL